jgi:hypothetical protein
MNSYSSAQKMEALCFSETLISVIPKSHPTTKPRRPATTQFLLSVVSIGSVKTYMAMSCGLKSGREGKVWTFFIQTTSPEALVIFLFLWGFPWESWGFAAPLEVV